MCAQPSAPHHSLGHIQNPSQFVDTFAEMLRVVNSRRVSLNKRHIRGFSSSSKHQFSFDIACRGKSCRSMLFPSPDACGEDSYFTQGTKTLGISDGVGGWKSKNVDPAIISRSLMQHASETASDDPLATPILILSEAYKKTLCDPNVYAGSTTACIIRLNEDKDHKLKLQYANLGDSGLLIVRNNEIVFQSAFQKYHGIAPYQLAKLPPELKNQGCIESSVEDADCGEFEVQEGDIVVLATDGVWDNFASDLRQRGSFLPVSSTLLYF